MGKRLFILFVLGVVFTMFSSTAFAVPSAWVYCIDGKTEVTDYSTEKIAKASRRGTVTFMKAFDYKSDAREFVKKNPICKN